MKKTNRPMFIIFIIFSVTAVILRVLGMLTDISLTVGTTLLNVGCVLLGVLCLFAGRYVRTPAVLSRNSMSLSFTAALLSMALIADGVICTVGFFSGEFVYGRFAAGELVMVLLLFVSAAYFAMFAAQKAGAVRRPIHPLFPAVVSLQMLVRLLLSFMKYTGYADIGENSYSIVMMAAFLWFWMFFGRTSAGLSKTETAFMHTPAAALYCAAVTLLPRLISELAVGGMLDNVGFGFSDAATLLFAAAVLADMMKERPAPKKPFADRIPETVDAVFSEDTEDIEI